MHQVELEIQHEELLQANRSLTQLRDEYRELFDFSPIGYFKLSLDGETSLMNRTLADLLGLPSGSHANSLARFIDSADRPDWDECLRGLRLGKQRCECLLQLAAMSGPPLFVKVFVSRFDSMHGGAMLGAVVPIDEREYRGR